MNIRPQLYVRPCRRCGADVVYRIDGQRFYCSRACFLRAKSWAYRMRRPRSELRALLQDRRCAECGGEMSLDLNVNARYCALRCKRAANAAQMREKRRMKRQQVTA